MGVAILHATMNTTHETRASNETNALPATILLVDDHTAIRETLTYLLKQEGHNVIPLADSQDAIDFVLNRGQHFDLVVTDICMPGLDGVRLTEMFKEVYPNIPVIVMSAFADENMIAETERFHAFAFLSKPVAKSVFLMAVRRALFEYRNVPQAA